MSVYGRHVAEWMASEYGDAVTVARFVRDNVPFRDYAYSERARTIRQVSGVEIRIITPSPPWVPALHLLNRTIDRRRLDWFTLRIIEHAYGRALDRALPPTTEVVHLVGSAWELLGFAALRVARSRGIAFTMCPAIHPGEWGDGPLDARLLAACDHVFALSAHEAGRLRELGVSWDRVATTPLGPATTADGNAARFRAEHGLGVAPIILFIGRKQRYKGYDAVVAALPLIRRDLADVKLVVIGAGATRQLGVDGLVELGEVDDRVKADALAACDVFCMPSSAEAFGMAYVEAWSYGKPVVVGTAPGPRELVEHGRTGLHADQDPVRLSHTLAKLLADPVRAQRFGEAGRTVQRRSYTWEAAWSAHSAGLAAAHARALRSASNSD